MNRIFNQNLSFFPLGQLCCIIFFIIILTIIIKIENNEIVIQAANSTYASRISISDFNSSNLPIIVINTGGQTIRDNYRIAADMGIIYNGEGERNSLTDPFNDYKGKIRIEIRGSSSQMFPKKQYGFETQDSGGNNLNVSLLGMPDENDWILYAPYSDKSLVRNVLIYKLANDMGHYASKTKFCELVLNDDYRGIYVLMEKIKRDKNRVDISKLNPDEIAGDDLTGGYILKIDKFAGESIGGWFSPFPPYLNAQQKIYYQYHYPKPDKIVPEQENYIQQFIYNFEYIMYTSEYADSISGYPQIIDINSFVDYFIMSEFSKNVDSYRLSAFMYKDKNSNNAKIVMGPVWDFNLAFGNADYYDGAKTEGWQLDYLTENVQFTRGDYFQVPFWWKRLIRDPNFLIKINLRWQDLRKQILDTDLYLNTIDSLTTYLDESQKRNFERWPVLDNYVWPNAYIGHTYENEITYLKQWIMDRLQWMDVNISEYNSIDLAQESPTIPGECFLNQNYPNPFNSLTVIRYGISAPNQVILSIINILGQEIITIVNEQQNAGYHQSFWDGKNSSGKPQTNGVYFCEIKVKSEKETFYQIKKMLLLK